MRLRDRIPFRLAGILLGLCLISLCACEGVRPAPESTAQTPTLEPQLEGRQPASAGEQSSSVTLDPDVWNSKPPIIAADGVNEEGLIVLGDDNNYDSVRVAAEEALHAAGATEQVLEPAESDAEEGGPRPMPVSASSRTAPEANVATFEERNQMIAADWPTPQAVLFVSGQQHGYIEPCGCTGLENQKGGLIRRDTLLKQLRERGWELIPVDVGNQVRRTGRQPELKFQTTVSALKKMGYRAVALGIDDLKLSSIELIQLAGSDGLNESPFIAANISIIDPSFFPSYRIVEAGGRRIGITAVLGLEHKGKLQSSDIEMFDPVEKLRQVMRELEEQGCDFKVLLAHASLGESAEIARQVEGLDLVVTAGGFGEPTLTPEPIDGSEAVMVQVGTKGMYGGIVGIFDDPQQPIRYQKIAISSQFKDSPRMLADFASYQQRLKEAGFTALGASPISHPSGRKFVGSEACGDCHTTAYSIWEESPHVHATVSVVEPDNERGGIPRHHDPECVSCHATGWNPQKFYPYDSGFVSPEETPLMVGSGCENCHGPGSAHVAAELGDVDATNEQLEALRQQMVLPLASARERCLECHDLDNSPDFEFDSYWEQVKHYGKD